jgi:ribosomal protein S6--L-glutamate ligase
MRIGVVGSKGGWSSELLADTVAEITGYHLLIEMDKVRLDLPSGKAWFQDTEISELDALIIKKIGGRYSPDLLDRLEVLRFLAAKGLRIFSSPMNIMKVLDRLSCTVTLQLADIPMPPTTVTEDVEQALIAVETYQEAVLKPLYTSKARGMVVIRNTDSPREALEEYRETNPIMYIQKRIDLPDQDLGLAFLGGEYLTTYARCKRNDAWNTSTTSGAEYAPFDPPQEVIDMAKEAQALFGLDFTCVDVAMTEEGPYVFEVSAFGGFRGLHVARGMNPAKDYAEYVIEKLHD